MKNRLVNQAEYARLHGVSRKTVTQWKAKGLLVFSKGKVDVRKSDQRLEGHGLGRYRGDTQPSGGSEVTPGGNAGAQKQDAASRPKKGDDGAPLDLSKPPEDWSYAEALRRKEIELVRKHELQRRVTEGELVPRAEVEKENFAIARQERDALLGWPAQISAVMAAELGVDPGLLSAVLERYVRDFLINRADQLATADPGSGDDGEEGGQAGMGERPAA